MTTTERTTMKVTVCGPNLRDQSKGEFHVHAAGCADLARGARREPMYRDGWTLDVASRLAVAAEMYADQIDENEGNAPYDAPAGYLADFHFFPCTSALPMSAPEEATS
jgi:hypothetical protein